MVLYAKINISFFIRKKIPRIFKIEDIKGTNVKPVKESVEVVEEGNELIDDIQKGLAKFDKFTKVKYSDRDLFFSLRYDLVKNNPKEMQDYLSKLIKAAQFEDDLHYVRKMARKADDYYKLRLKKNPDLKDEYEKYYDWFKNGGMDKDIKKKGKKVIKESYITDTMEESSISIPQMSYYLQNQYEEDMKDYLNTYKKYYNLMLKEQPAAVKHINEDIRKCLIVIDGMASKGVENNLVQFAKDDLGEIVKAAKHGKPVKVYEGTNIINIKVVYDNPNSTQAFSLSDRTSKIIIEEEYIVQRDKVGTHCSVTPYYNEIERPNEKEFQIELSESVNVEEICNSLTEGVIIAGLFKFNEQRFINEVSLKLFGSYPVNIKEVR